MKQILLMLGGVFIFILIVGLLIKNQPTKAPTSASPSNLKEMKIANVKLMVEIADTDVKRSKGLGGIESLPASQGMLFTFESKNIRPAFWMKGMVIPLDFIWIKDAKVVEIDPNILAPVPNTPDDKLQKIIPAENIDYCLEVNAGFAAKQNIKVGDNVTLP